MPSMADPFSFLPPGKTKLDKDGLIQALRLDIASELEAMQLYEAHAGATDDTFVAQALRNIADEEKTHVGELTQLLRRLNEPVDKHLREGRKEVMEEAEEKSSTDRSVTPLQAALSATQGIDPEEATIEVEPAKKKRKKRLNNAARGLRNNAPSGPNDFGLAANVLVGMGGVAAIAGGSALLRGILRSQLEREQSRNRGSIVGVDSSERAMPSLKYRQGTNIVDEAWRRVYTPQASRHQASSFYIRPDKATRARLRAIPPPR